MVIKTQINFGLKAQALAFEAMYDINEGCRANANRYALAFARLCINAQGC